MTIEAGLRFVPVAAAVVSTVAALIAARGRRPGTAAVFVLGLLAIAAVAWQQHRLDAQTRALAMRPTETAGKPAPAKPDGGAANKRAEQRLAEDAVRIKQLEEKIARLGQTGRSRMLDARTAAALKQYLRWFPGQHVIVSCPPEDVEAFDYANQLVSVLQDAGWDAKGPETTQIFGEKPSMRIEIYANGAELPQAAKILADALRKYDIPYQSGIAPSDTAPAADSVELYVPPKSAAAEATSGSAQPPR